MSLEQLNALVRGPITVNVPKQEAGTNNDVRGVLHLQASGYLYSPGKRTTVWWNFLALCFYTSAHVIALRISHLFGRVFLLEDRQRIKRSLEHMSCLRALAWKAVAAGDQDDLINHVEAFAMAELRFNNPDIGKELAKSRSMRFQEGIYLARCMQPLFHKADYLKGSPVQATVLEAELKKLQEKQGLIQDALDCQSDHTFSRWWSTAKSLLSSNPYKELDALQLAAAHQDSKVLETQFTSKLRINQNYRKQSELCSKYAKMAVLAQMGLMGRIKDLTVTTQEWKCFDLTVLRHDQICGILHRVECCATACWALDCYCCYCCVWPDAQAMGWGC
jgi:hypothetical protein